MTGVDVSALVRRMTLEEKCAQLGAVRYLHLLTDGELDGGKVALALANGIGHVATIAGSSFDPIDAARGNNEIQRFLIERTRVGIPAVVHEEALEGLMGPGATQFPQAIGMASTWDLDLVEQVAATAGRQARALGGRLMLGPVLDIARDARWGRTEETFGEDPMLASRMGVAFVRGMQSAGVRCCAKHFIGHGSSLGGLNHNEVVIGPRRLRDVDAAPFRAAIHEADLSCVMNAYHELDGLPCASAPEILTDLLRGELGFEGCVVADYFAINDLVDFHRVAADKEEAARLALAAGLDVELPSSDYFLTLPDQVRDGLVDEALIDRACHRVLEQKVASGLFEDPYADVDAVPFEMNTDADKALARRAAARSIVLLTNDGTLPLRAGCRVAVLGPSAVEARRLFGDYSYAFHKFHISPDAVAPYEIDASSTPVMTPQEAVAQHFETVDDLASADVALVFVGGMSGAMQGDTSGEFLDASDLRLAAEQLALIAEVAASGIPTVVTVIGGRAHSLAEVVPHAAALVMAWLPGEEGAAGIVDVLSGAVDAGGRLPLSLLHSVGQIGIYAAHHHGGGRSVVYGDYIDGPATPLFPFGHGLSYTTWSYDDLRIDSGSTSEDISIAVSVTNTGQREGDEVVQVYARDEVASIGVPARRLVAFRRVTAPAGTTVRIRFTVPAGSLGFHGADMRFRVEPGIVTFVVGSCSTTVRLTGDVAHPDANHIEPFSSSPASW